MRKRAIRPWKFASGTGAPLRSRKTLVLCIHGWVKYTYLRRSGRSTIEGPKVHQALSERFVGAGSGFDPFEGDACPFGGLVSRCRWRDRNNPWQYESEPAGCFQNRCEADAGREAQLRARNSEKHINMRARLRRLPPLLAASRKTGKSASIEPGSFQGCQKSYYYQTRRRRQGRGELQAPDRSSPIRKFVRSSTRLVDKRLPNTRQTGLTPRLGVINPLSHWAADRRPGRSILRDAHIRGRCQEERPKGAHLG